MEVVDPHLSLILSEFVILPLPFMSYYFGAYSGPCFFLIWSIETALNSANHRHLSSVGSLGLQLPALHLDSALM